MPIVRSATSQCGLHSGRGAELAAMLGYYTIQHINQTFVSARAHIYGQYNVNWHSGTAGISIEPLQAGWHWPIPMEDVRA